MMGVFGYALVHRNPFQVDVLRERGELYQEMPGDLIGNQYRLRLMNKSQRNATVTVSAVSALPVQLSITEPVRLAPEDLLDLPLTVTAPRSLLTVPNVPVTIRICEQQSGRCDSEQTRFLGPRS